MIQPTGAAFVEPSHRQGSQQLNYHSARGHPVRAAGRPGYGDQRRPGCGDPRHRRALGVALVVGTLALFIGYIRRKRREGQPWLFHFILWPAYIGVLAVLGLAALHSSDNACGGPYECVGRIPLYWLPASLVLLSALLWRVEDFIIERRKSRLPAASTGPRSGPSER